MPAEADIQYMSSAYRLLFEIEVTLEKEIDARLTASYGPSWELKLQTPRRLHTTFFHEKVSYFGKYAPISSIFTEKELKKLYRLTYTRNKIAHMELINGMEEELLHECHQFVVEKLT
ncbi:hypothetical protein [Salsuginibacillus kocurii]|uniref:hypothetical protein n=1 Tax=Salsuginibacillus kocurii TaxID=427078 RepID=UPI0003777C83|nr:hypothetical protein [Salsuginibacillus kocurii]